MVSSLLVIFFHHSGARLSGASLLGVQLTFENPNAVITFLWVFLAYYLFRYYQYLRQEPDLPIHNEFWGRISQDAYSKVHALKNRAFPGLEEYGGDYDFRKMRRISVWRRSVKAVARRDAVGGFENDEFVLDIRQFWREGLLALLHVIFNRSYITDYLLPFALSFAALAVAMAN
jgi:hypothetical protein